MSAPEPRHFELDGIRFVEDIRPGPQRGHSTQDEFVIVKTDSFIKYYESLLDRAPKTILEIGMFEGGSLVLLDRMFKPERLVGVDIRPPIPALERYREIRPHISAHYHLSQDDEALDVVLAQRFPDGIDLIIDDASHLYEQTRATFEIAFPHLKPGGVYVIEDWAWSHAEGQQVEGHPWYARKALTNLVFELLINLPRSSQLASIDVRPELLAIEKRPGAHGRIDLDVGHTHLRGRSLPQI